MQTFNLDISEKRGVQRLNVKQRDVGAKILVELTDNKKEYGVPDGVTWSVWYSGASGEGNYTKIDGRDAFSIDGNKVTVELIYQMLNNPGEHAMCLVMNGADGTQLGLWNIPYFVEPIPGADSKPAIAYYQAFLKAQENAEKAAQEAKDASKVAAKNAVAAVVQEIDVSEAGDGSVLLRLYSSGGGYDAVVTGTGAIKDHTDNNRPYDAGKVCTLHIGEGITSIGAYFMYGAWDLKHLTFADGCKITHLKDRAFSRSGITEANFLSLTEMGNAVFNSCTSLVSANLGGNITTLPKGTFSNCLELEKITGLGSVESVGIGACKLTPKLAAMDFDTAKLTEVQALAFYASGFEYEWENLTECTFGSYSIASQLNEGEPWANLIIAECENPLPTLFHQGYDKWAGEKIGSSATTYAGGCVLFSFLHAYCGLTSQHMNVPTEFTGDVLDGYETKMEYVEALASAFDLETVKYDTFDAESLQALYDALVEGKYAVLRLGGHNITYVTDENTDNDWVSLGGHVVMVYGVRRDGKLLIADSNFTKGGGKGCTYALHPKAFIPSVPAYEEKKEFAYILEKENGMLKSIDERLETTGSKLDALAESMASVGRGFRTESGTLVVDADMLPAEGETAVTVRIPCSNGAKTVDFHADDATMAEIKATTGTEYVASFLGNFFAPKVGQAATGNKPRSYYSAMMLEESLKENSKYNYGWLVDDCGTHNAANTDGVTFPAKALKAGTYEWTAYYWNN